MPLVPSQRFAPVGAEPQPGLLEGAALGGGADAIEDHPAGIGEQHRMAGAGELLVQAVHLAVGDLQHLAQALAAFEHARVLQHHRRHRLAGIEVVLLQAAQPGAGDGRVGRRAARRGPCPGRRSGPGGRGGSWNRWRAFLLFSAWGTGRQPRIPATVCQTIRRNAEQHPPRVKPMQRLSDRQVTTVTNTGQRVTQPCARGVTGRFPAPGSIRRNPSGAPRAFRHWHGPALALRLRQARQRVLP